MISLEQALHVFVEPGIQAWAVHTKWLMDIAACDVPQRALRRDDRGAGLDLPAPQRAFYFVRNMFMVAMAFALVGYALYPTAPPRLLPEWGFTDSVQQFTGVTVEHGPASALLNLYAAVPSMHVCFALMIGWPMARLVSRGCARVAWALYPLFITFVVVATGNHWSSTPSSARSPRGVGAALQAAAGPRAARRVGVRPRAAPADALGWMAVASSPPDRRPPRPRRPRPPGGPTTRS